MGIRNRLKGFVLEQGSRVRNKLGTFNVMTGPAAPSPSYAPAPLAEQRTEPAARRVLRAPVIVAAKSEPARQDSLEVRIKAQAARDGSSCTLMLDQAVLPGASWVFPDSESAAGSKLAEELFALGDIEEVLLDDDTVVLSGSPGDQGWEPLARRAASRLRVQLSEGGDALSAEQRALIPNQDLVRERVQQALDEVVNPGVAAHSGHIRLERVRGNSVWIEMGGGCQGCSAADLTLRQGIHTAFRDAVPGLGAIYDATDHAAGTNPWFR